MERRLRSALLLLLLALATLAPLAVMQAVHAVKIVIARRRAYGAGKEGFSNSSAWADWTYPVAGPVGSSGTSALDASGQADVRAQIDGTYHSGAAPCAPVAADSGSGVGLPQEWRPTADKETCSLDLLDLLVRNDCSAGNSLLFDDAVVSGAHIDPQTLRCHVLFRSDADEASLRAYRKRVNVQARVRAALAARSTEAALKAQVAGLQQEIDAIKASVSSYAARLSAAKQHVDAQEATRADLAAQIQSKQAALATLEGQKAVFDKELAAARKKESAASTSVSGGDRVYTTSDGHVVHVFTSSGALDVNRSGGVTADILIVGGGGSGGAQDAFDTAGGGGGGAGGLMWKTGVELRPGSHRVTVGAGAALPRQPARGDKSCCVGLSGGNSSFNTLVALGGGGGGTRDRAPGAGGSGGGARSETFTRAGGKALQPTRPEGGGMGHAGGTGHGGAGNAQGGGGGGGAGQPGAPNSGSNGGDGGQGGQGHDLSAELGQTVGQGGWFAAGGGGGSSTAHEAAGGRGGGGSGARGGGGAASSGMPGTGAGGGGGADHNARPGAGGSGVVIVRYPLLASSS